MKFVLRVLSAWILLALYGYSPAKAPQTSLLYGRVGDRQAIFKNRTSSFKEDVFDAKVYGFDMEVPYSQYANIGVLGRWESGSARLREGLDIDLLNIHAGLGVFTRLQVAVFSPNLLVFTKAEAYGGPFLMGFSGVEGGLGLHVGCDLYLSDWFGLTFSMGQAESLGLETLLSNVDGFKDKDKGGVLWTHGSSRVVLLGLKSTYF